MVLTYLGNQVWYTDTVSERPTGVNNQAVIVELPTRRVYYYSGTAWEESAGGGGSGEVNTGSNVGTAGVGVFKQKNVFDFQFKKINAGSNRVTITDDTANDEIDVNIVESNIPLTNFAGSLPYSKTTLTNSIVNTDISPAAAIAYPKLNLADSIMNADINTSAGIQYSKLLLTDAILNTDINASAGITYGKLSLTNSIVNADINTAAAIPYSKLNLAGGVLNADVNAAAAIAWSKLSKTGSLLDDMGDVNISTPATNDVLTWNGTNWVSAAPPGASGGEANTMENIPTASGVGIYKQKTGVKFELKKINAGSTKITVTDDLINNEIDIDAATETVLTNQANTFGDFTQQFRSGKLEIRDSDNSHSYIMSASNLAANRTITLPLLTGNDIAVMEAFAQTLTNKTISIDANTLKHSTTNSLGDILYNNGTQFIRLARGTANQVLTVNSGGTDIAWAAPASSGGNVSTGQSNTFGDFDQIFRSGRLDVMNPANTFAYSLTGSAIVAARAITLPLLAADDTMVTAAFAQTLTNKTLDHLTKVKNVAATSATQFDIYPSISTIADTTTRSTLRVWNNDDGTNNEFVELKSKGTAGFALEVGKNGTGSIRDFAITIGGVIKLLYTQATDVIEYNSAYSLFHDGSLLVRSPGATGNYVFVASAISGSKNITLPLLTGNDTFVFEAHTQTLTNKTLTIPKFSSNATGAGTAALGTANSPAVTNTAPYTWLRMLSSDGSTVYVPAWK